MKSKVYGLLLLVSACSDASEQHKASVELASVKNNVSCEFDFHTTEPCVYRNIQVALQSKPLAFDEKQIQTLQVSYKGLSQALNVSADSHLLEGDKGYISFADINFDAVPDLAITTSFGLANLYMDYWVYDTQHKRYVKVGNFARLELQMQEKTLVNQIRVNAASYEKNTYRWQGHKLVKQ